MTETKKALLVVSFGTSYADTRERTIGAIEARMKERFPDRKVCRAWTSNFIIKRVAEAEGLSIDTPAEALQRLAGAGVSDLIVQPTHLSDGYENRRMMEIVREYAGLFERVSVGRPLLHTEEDREAVAEILPALCLRESGEERTETDRSGKPIAGGEGDTALMLMGHGSRKHPVPVYGQLQKTFFRRGMDKVFVGTVEGTPTFREAADLLRKSGCRKVVLAPLMIVAGDHAVSDMAGEDPDSWQSRLQAGGYSTKVSMAGLGEYGEIQELFVKHAREAQSIQDQ